MNRGPTIVFLLILQFSIQIGKAQNQKIDSLHSLIKSQENDTLLITVCYELFNVYFPNNVDSSKKYLDKGLRQSDNTGNKKFYLQGLNFLSMFWLERGLADSALVSSREAIKLKDIGNKDMEYKALLNMARSLQTSSRFDESVKWYLRSLELAENLDDPSMIVASLTNLGTVYWDLQDFDRALEYYERSFKISEENEFLSEMASNLGNLGLIYKTQGNLNRALECYLRSNEIFRELNYKFHIAISHQNIGVLYEEREMWDEARINFEESNRISKEIDDKIGIALTTINLAIVEGKTGNFKKSIQLFDSALSYSSRIDYKPAIKEAYLAYSEIYSDMGEYQKAFEARKNYEIWKDSLLNENYLETISDLEAKYEFEKKQREILTLSEENLIHEAAIQTKDFWIKLLFVALFFMALVAVLTIVIVRQKMRFKSKEMVFNAVSDAEIKEQQRVARDLHDSIGAMLALIKNKLSGMSWNEFNDSTRTELENINELVSKTSVETRRIAHNMIPQDLMKFGLVTATESMIDSLKNNGIKFNCNHFGMEGRMDQIKELNIFRIIQELIQNSLKHAFPKNVHISFMRHADNLNIIVQDNGKGFEKGHVHETGMGMSNIQTRLKLLNAKWQIDSDPKLGTSIVLDIPVKL